MPKIESPENLWSLIRAGPQIDPAALLRAMEAECGHEALDFRTRLLLRDAYAVVRKFWGDNRVEESLSSGAIQVLKRIDAEDLGKPGFAHLEQSMREPTDSQAIIQFLRELGAGIHSPVRLILGGSGALILAGLLRRYTEDIDAVDEIPIAIREQHEILERLALRYRISLAHFQSHYLPDGWASRLNSLGSFGAISVSLIDPLDIFVGKFFSRREKDRDDLRVLAPRMDRAKLLDRMRGSAMKLMADTTLRSNAEFNWQLIYGEALPALNQGK